MSTKPSSIDERQKLLSQNNGQQDNTTMKSPTPQSYTTPNYKTSDRSDINYKQTFNPIWVSGDLSSGGSYMTSVKWNILFPNENNPQLNIFLGVCYTLVILYSILIFLGPFILHFIEKEIWCSLTNEEQPILQDERFMQSYDPSNRSESDNPYDNPDYITDPCRYHRVPNLFYLTLEECDICRRLLTAVLLGGLIGYERRTADRPAGIRVMGLVSLGACFFTTSSIMAFKSSTMGWDASRVTAALPSGVGFLGGALIWKGTVQVEDEEVHQVHGLTTAASLWLSAAVGVGIGGSLYLVTIYVTMLVIMILRFGPSNYRLVDEGEDNEHGNEGLDFEPTDPTATGKDTGPNMYSTNSEEVPIPRASSRVSIGSSFPYQEQTQSPTRPSIMNSRQSTRKSTKHLPTFND